MTLDLQSNVDHHHLLSLLLILSKLGVNSATGPFRDLWFKQFTGNYQHAGGP
jgi:hypothetical protein